MILYCYIPWAVSNQYLLAKHWLHWLHWLQSRFKPSLQITLMLSVQRSYLLTYSYNIVLLYSLDCIHPIPTCQTLITPITLVTESCLTICTDTVQLPVNGPCKSRYLTKNVICSTVLSLNIELYHCIAVFPGLYPNTTYMPNTDYTDYTGYRVVLNHLHR